MSAVKKIEEEILGSGGAFLHNNGSGGVEIRDTHPGDPLDVEENPFFPAIMNQDGGASEAWHRFEQEPQPTGAGPAPIEPAHSDAQMTEISQRKAAQEAALESEAPWTRINPRSAIVGVLGGTGLVSQSDLVNGRTVQVARWEGDSVESLPVSISLSPLASQYVLAVGEKIRPFARIQFGTRDGKHSFDCDIGSGTQLVLPASVVYVDVGLDPTSNTPTPFGMSASIGFYPIIRTVPLTLTSYMDNLAGGASTTLGRPRFAAQIIGLTRIDPTTPVSIELQDAFGQTIDVINLMANQRLDVPIVLPADCIYVTITNGAAAGFDTLRAIWGLTL